MRIRKKRGNFLEDFSVGQVFRHKVGKTVTEGLFNAFTEFGMTTNPLSKNRALCRTVRFPRAGGPARFGDEYRLQPER